MSTAGKQEGTLVPSAQAATLLSSFTTFLTLTLHSLLYHRGLYPSTSFLTARAFNLPVQQSRHPGLCAWINDAVAAVSTQLRSGRVDRIAVSMHAPKSFDVLERWVFDVASFPDWGPAMEDKTAEEDDLGLEEEEDDEDEEEPEEEVVNFTDVNEALRGALRRIAHAGESMPHLPTGSTFTVAVELGDNAPPPIGASPQVPITHTIRLTSQAPSTLDPVSATSPTISTISSSITQQWQYHHTSTRGPGRTSLF